MMRPIWRLSRRLAILLAALWLIAPAAAGAAESRVKESPTQPFVELPTLTATVMLPGGRHGVLTVQATLYIPNPAQRAKASLSMPMLLDAYVPAMQGFAYHLSPDAAPNVDFLSYALQRASDQVLGAGSRVLLGGVMVN